MIWSKETTLIICVFVSTDGWVYCKNQKLLEVAIVSSNDKEWLYVLKEYFDKEKISVSINKGRGEIMMGGSLCKPIFIMRLNRRYPKRIGTIRQYQILRDSIEYWNLHTFLRKEKYEKLCIGTQGKKHAYTMSRGLDIYRAQALKEAEAK